MDNSTEQQSSARSADGVTLRNLLAPLFRHWVLLAVSFFAVLTLTLAFLILRGKQYESHMEVLVTHERMDPLVSSEATSHSGVMTLPVTEEEINSEAELLKSQDLLEKVAIANGLQHQVSGGFLSRFTKQQPNEAARLQQAVTQLAKDLRIKTIPKSNVLDISYSSNDPRVTFGVLNSLGTLYIDKHVVLHSAPGSYAFFAGETLRYQNAMKNTEEKLRELAHTGLIASPELEQAGLARQVTDSIGQLHTAEEAIAADQNRLRSDRERLETLNERTDTSKSTTPPSLLLQQLGADLLKAKTKRTELASKYQPGYPLVAEADEEVKIAQEAFDRADKTSYLSETTDRNPIYDFLNQDIAKTEADLASQRGSLQASQQSIASMQAQLIKLGDVSSNQADLVRELKSDEASYLLYLGKREEEGASDALDKIRIANVTIAVPPALPALPVAGAFSPILTALAIALIFSIALTYLRAYFDTSFHDPEEVGNELDVPFVIAMPKRAA